jgi:hypothetical protein
MRSRHDSYCSLCTLVSIIVSPQQLLSNLETQLNETATNDEKLKKLQVQYTEMREIITKSNDYFSEVCLPGLLV